jgi:hypothetical protein
VGVSVSVVLPTGEQATIRCQKNPGVALGTVGYHYRFTPRLPVGFSGGSKPLSIEVYGTLAVVLPDHKYAGSGIGL